MTEQPESQPDPADDEQIGEPETSPPGSPEPDSEDVERSQEKLDEVSGH